MSRDEINLRAAKLRAAKDSREHVDKFVYVYHNVFMEGYTISVGKLKKHKPLHCFKNGNEIAI